MSELAVVIRDFPMHELAVRRLYARLADFRSLCEDYAIARKALERWRGDEKKFRDFEALSDELSAEIEEIIRDELKALHRDDPP